MDRDEFKFILNIEQQYENTVIRLAYADYLEERGFYEDCTLCKGKGYRRNKRCFLCNGTKIINKNLLKSKFIQLICSGEKDVDLIYCKYNIIFSDDNPTCISKRKLYNYGLQQHLGLIKVAMLNYDHWKRYGPKLCIENPIQEVVITNYSCNYFDFWGTQIHRIDINQYLVQLCREQYWREYGKLA